MKKFFIIFICVLTIIGITGCGSSKNSESNSDNSGNKTGSSFATDDWKTIVENVKSGKTYKVGDTKEIDMGELGKHTIRVANTSTPDECKKDGFSQTACGFVLEFADTLTDHNMNTENTNVGGWKDSEIRTYVNTDIFNALPEELKNLIIDTKVISGHGNTSGETNFTTNDKLYLLSTVEVFGKEYADTLTTEMTRQLDYYNNLGVTNRNYSGAKKNNDYWWLRSANSNEFRLFNYISGNGNVSNSFAYKTNRVSPAFRIG